MTRGAFVHHHSVLIFITLFVLDTFHPKVEKKEVYEERREREKMRREMSHTKCVPLVWHPGEKPP